jgi:hypothetical protein
VISNPPETMTHRDPSKIGRGGGDRTRDLLLKRQLLYH